MPGMNLQERKALLIRLGAYMLSDDEGWKAAQVKAFQENNWFIPEFVERAVQSIAHAYLQADAVQTLIDRYDLPATNPSPKKVGIVMAGNIPLVGFHDFLCVFLSGHYAHIKPSSKDEALIKHLVNKLIEWNELIRDWVQLLPLLKNCDAYIATGSNNSSRYFDYYFKNYPSIIRRNRTSVAVLTGRETREELEALADDVHLYFGLGCRNVSQLFVPQGYDFVPLLEAFRKWGHLINHNKYKNNYDYNLALHILNNQFYMTNGSIILVENASPFAPISQVHFQYYQKPEELPQANENLQCLLGAGHIPFGEAQQPGVCDYADGVDTMLFLKGLS
jgi:hypothetical protein